MNATWSKQQVWEREQREVQVEKDRVYRVTRANKTRAKTDGERFSADLERAIKNDPRPHTLDCICARCEGPRPRKASGALRIPKGMNKTEQRYAQHLELQKRAGAVIWYKFEGITLKLADDTRYTPDFAVLGCGGNLEMHEVKGFWRDDAKVKIKIAAEMFPFEFLAIFAEKGGKWRNEHF